MAAVGMLRPSRAQENISPNSGVGFGRRLFCIVFLRTRNALTPKWRLGIIVGWSSGLCLKAKGDARRPK